MNTFLPYSSYSQSAQVLDRQRLGCQRVEGLIVLRTNLGLSSGWMNHPITKMWRNYELSLGEYLLAIIREWKGRGYRDICEEKVISLVGDVKSAPKPYWLGDERLHSSHRSSLLSKNSSWYSQFGWSEVPKMEYFYPKS